MRRQSSSWFLFAACLLVSGACQAPGFSGGRWIDLTHDFGDDTIYWPTASGFDLSVDSRGPNPKGYWYEANSFCTAEHGGTHLDAPVHFAQGKMSVEQIPIESLVGPACVLDLSDAAGSDRDYQVSVADFEAWEAEHGRLPDGAIVLLNTGFARFWPDRVRYMGTDARGPEAVADLHFPGLAPAAARWLVEQRSINAIGLDTPSIDYGQSTLFESHCILFEEDIPAFENVAGLDFVPATGAYVIALPMKIRGGSGGPLRIVAYVP